MATAGRVVFEKSHKPYSTVFSASQVPCFTVEVVIKNGTHSPSNSSELQEGGLAQPWAPL